MPARTGKQGVEILHVTKVNERWRVALAGLVAALAIPFLIIDSPAPAEGVETNAQDAVPEPLDDTAIHSDPVDAEVAGAVVVPTNAVEIIVTNKEVAPDISRLADQAGTWGLARAQAIEDGRVDATFTPPPSKTDYSLLPVVATEPEADESAPEEPKATDADDSVPEEGNVEAGPEDAADEPVEPAPEAEGDDTLPTGEDPEPVEPETPVAIDQPAAPPQVDGRVPPPSGGPTAAQWNALRKCESTHNYAAISPSGLYRGAYQFSQQTWDWVAGIHWPHLVGVDPIDAQPGWQDVMAYTLYAMRGWDQWPICGKNLL